MFLSEFVQEAIAYPNLPFTLLLGVVLLYWLLVLVGALDFEMDLVDFGPSSADVTEVPFSGGPMGGAMLTAGRFLGFTQVPVAVWGSFFILFVWLFSMILNHRFNAPEDGRTLVTAAWLLVPGTIASLVMTKLVTLPVARLYAAMSDVTTESMLVLNRQGIVTTTELDDQHGQVQVNQDGVPALINARLRPGSGTLKKGDSVRVLEPSPEGSFYFVEPHSPSILP